MRDALAAVTRAHADAPHRPHVEVVDVRDLAARRERRVGPRVHGRPADDLVALVGEHARRSLLHERRDLAAARRCRRARGSPSTGCGSSGTSTRSRRAASARPSSSRRRTSVGRTHLDVHADTVPPASDTASRRHVTSPAQHLERVGEVGGVLGRERHPVPRRGWANESSCACSHCRVSPRRADSVGSPP